MKLVWPAEENLELNTVQKGSGVADTLYTRTVCPFIELQNKTLQKRQGMKEVMKLQLLLRRRSTDHSEVRRGRNFKRNIS
jgi:hypothetical protein